MKNKFLVITSIALATVFLTGCFADNDKPPVNDPTKAYLPESCLNYEGKIYTEVVEDLENTGFTNIEFEIVYDLITGWLVSDGEIEYINVDGDKNFSDEVYSKDVKIIIGE